MDNLRLILLIIGCFVVLGIYLREVFFNQEARKSSDILDAVDEFPDAPELQEISSPSIQIKPEVPQSNDDYSTGLADLGSLLTQSRNESLLGTESADAINTNKPIKETAEEDEALPLQMSVKDFEASVADNDNFDIPVTVEEEGYNQNNDLFEESHTEESSCQQEEQENVVEKELPDGNKNCGDILVLYITSPRNTLFNGLSISKAADEVGMIYGHMNIFHHFGPGKLHSGQPLFSMANMYEPGSFDLGRMSDLKTNGISIFMYSPASIDSTVVFELFLNTAQRIAELLGGEIRAANNELLNSELIKSLRDKAESLSVS